MAETGYVRYLAKQGSFLTYHRSDCFQIQRHLAKAEAVPLTEVLAADAQVAGHWAVRVQFNGRRVFLNICRSCLLLPVSETPWPPTT